MAGTADEVPLGKVFGIALALFLTLFTIETLFSSTALITPIDDNLLVAARIVGGLIGLGVAVLLFARMRQNSGTGRAIVTLIFLPLFTAAGFDGIAWRAADWASFGFSQQPFEQAQYPITSLSHGRKGRRSAVAINPFKAGSVYIPVPSAQYRELSADSHNLCVTVMQRKAANGAIEIRTDGQYNLKSPEPVEIMPCNTSASASDRPAT